MIRDERDRRLDFAGYRDAALRVAAALARLGAVQNPILPIHREREAAYRVPCRRDEPGGRSCRYARRDRGAGESARGGACRDEALGFEEMVEFLAAQRLARQKLPEQGMDDRTKKTQGDPT